MTSFDFEAYLAPLAEDSPCGPDLEYDPSFLAMVQASRSRAADERLDADGRIVTISESQSADWHSVKALALDLLARTKDIRVLIQLIGAGLRLDGPVALADGVETLRGYLERYWDTVHPQLEEWDDDDPTMRLNALSGLCDRELIRLGLRDCPLASSDTLGRACQRDILMATGQLASPAVTEPPSMATIAVIFLDCDIGGLQASRDAIVRTQAALTAIKEVVAKKVGSAMAPDLGPFESAVGELREILDDQFFQRELTGRVYRSRDDVIRALDGCCDYLARSEPSSPVPILLARARRLVSMSFLEDLSRGSTRDD